MKLKTQFALGAGFMFLAVAIGAFGAHALRPYFSEQGLETFKTGSLYHFIHALSILIIALANAQTKNLFSKAPALFSLGILLFSFNCYLYAILQIKTFAMIVPVGGIVFLLSWIYIFIKTLKSHI